MTIQLLFFAQARERAGSDRAALELPDGSRVTDALRRIGERYPSLVELMPHLAVAVNRRLVKGEDALEEGAELALLPPVSGGAERAPRVAEAPLRVVPVTPDRWPDLETLFGPRGACAGCWCMWARLPRTEYEAGRGAGNKRRLKKRVREGPPPGLIGYRGDEPVAWCAIGPREEFRRLATSRALAPVDDRAVWSVPCFFVARGHRGQGLTAAMLGEAVTFARAQGVAILEGYPIDPKGKTGDAFAWWGLVGAFAKAGFTEAARRTPTHPVMRRRLRGAPARSTRG